jgi:hypothetical protein
VKCYLDTGGNTMTKGLVAIQVGVDRRLSTLQYFEQLSPRITSQSLTTSGTLGGGIMRLFAQCVDTARHPPPPPPAPAVFAAVHFPPPPLPPSFPLL